MKRICPIILFTVCVAANVLAQRASSVQPTPTPPTDEVVRVSVTLVQVDAIVKDKDGRPVTDLRPEDFEILEDGRPQIISHFSYITGVASEKTSKPVRPARRETGVAAIPSIPTRVRPEEVRRTIVFVLDGMSFDSLTEARKALKKFIGTQMQIGDLVAILRMGEGMSALQQFTTDKRLLELAVEGVRWVPSELYGVNAIPDIAGNAPTSIAAEETTPDANDETAKAEENRYDDRRRLHGKLASLSLIVRGIERLPGRKTVFIFSEDMRLFGSTWDGYDNERAGEELRIVSGQANRALVTINPIDVRGIPALNVGASDSLDQHSVLGRESLKPTNAHPDANVYGAIAASRRAAFLKAQEGMHELAKRTGGRFSRSNDPAADVGDVLHDDKGYYLLAYTLDDDATKAADARRSFHKLEVRVKRPGLRVASRKEYYGVPPVDLQLRDNEPAQRLVAALTSPYAQRDVGLRLSSLFGHDVKEGPFVRSLLHVATRDLTFTEDSDGKLRAAIKIVVIAFDTNGIVGEPIAQHFTIRAWPDKMERVKRDGVIYEMMTPVSQAGAYQVRAAVQDVSTERIGAADQFIDVPDVRSGRLALSGLLVSGKGPASGDGADIQASAAVRRLRRGMQLSFALIAYNPSAGRCARTASAQLEARVSVYRNGQVVYTSPLEISPAQRSDLKQIVLKGAFPLDTRFTPGEYILQVAVVDKLAQSRLRTAARWIDFEVVD